MIINQYIDIKEAAQIAKASVSTVRAWKREGKVVALRNPERKKVVFDRLKFQHFVETGRWPKAV